MPKVVIEIQPTYVLGASLEGSGRSGRRLTQISLKELPAGVLEPSPHRPNVADGEVLRNALGMCSRWWEMAGAILDF